MIDYKLLLDSSAWLGYFLQVDKLMGEMVESHEGKLFSSAISFYEVPRKLHVLKRSEGFINEVVRFMRQNSTVISVDSQLATYSVKWAVKKKLALADSIIYQSAVSHGLLLITADNDFKGLPNAQVVNV
jgi:PIN domain nuclease of toxin-antitoxin system